jgi:adenine C2-methylase RlmN of 23S rRNA A2503 and tRNA A37
MTARILNPKSLLDIESLQQRCDELEIKSLHIGKMYQQLLQKGISRVRDMEGLPTLLCELIEQEFQLPTSRLIESKTSNDNSTTKVGVQWLFACVFQLVSRSPSTLRRVRSL